MANTGAYLFHQALWARPILWRRVRVLANKERLIRRGLGIKGWGVVKRKRQEVVVMVVVDGGGGGGGA
jgi:hypothetical protein